jgi:hypothetical protein
MIERMDRLVTPGSTWYLIAMDWVKRWQSYTFYDYLEEDETPNSEPITE